MKIGSPMNQLRRLHHSTQTSTPGGYTQVPVSDEVIDLFERLEPIYRAQGVRCRCASCAGSGVWHNWHNGRSNGGLARAVERVPPQTASYACA
jgi:hypothetical protein